MSLIRIPVYAVCLTTSAGHREAYRIGKVLHRDLSENNLMIARLEDGTANGLLNDWDMASVWKNGVGDTITAAHHRTGTPPFMAIDLLRAELWGHLYRYELESFVYILVWAAVHYNLKAKTRAERVHKALINWVTGTLAARGKEKQGFVMIKNGDARNDFNDAVSKEFEPIVETIIDPLLDLLSMGYADKPTKKKAATTDYDYETCGGHITFHKFMKKIGKTPRWDKVEPDSGDA